MPNTVNTPMTPYEYPNSSQLSERNMGIETARPCIIQEQL